MQQGLDTCVLEIGFGLGLNCLLTADAALAQGVSLAYHGFEHDLVSRETFAAMQYQTHLSQPELVKRLADAVFTADAAPVANDRQRHINIAGANNVSIELWLSLSDAVNEVWPPNTDSTAFDAIYLDAFSPDTNAECWSEEMLSRLFSALRSDGGTLATYCAKGVVRRSLEAVGFVVTRHPGPPGKREILSARRTS